MKKKTKNVPISEEERDRIDLKNIRRQYIPTPTIFYKEGERVEVGNITESHIVKVMDDGLFYKVHHKHVEEKHGQEIISESERYITWMNLLPYRTQEKATGVEKFTVENDLRLNYMQQDISCLLSKIYFFGVDGDTEYQRPYVWNLEDKVYLIESIFNNVDIGKFCFIHREFAYEEDGSIRKLYEVLDGKQRLKALTDFYEGRFKYKGLYFRELNRRDQCHFEYYPVSVGECRNLSREDKLRYFLKLNVSGKAQDPKHLEFVKSLYLNSNKGE